MGPQRDDQWRETGILRKFPDAGPKVLWRVPIAGGYAGPAVAGGKVYVVDFATDADFRKLSAPQSRPEVKGQERVLCFDAKTGKEQWKYAYDCKYSIAYPAGPRCTPTVHEDKVYTLGSEGNLLCLDAARGTVLWSKNFKTDYKAKTPGWGFCGHPLVDGQKLICIVGGEEGVVYAFDKDTGKVLWHNLEASEPGYSAPTMIEAGGKRQLIIWHADAINALDPETGKLYWTIPLKPSFGMAIMAPRQSGEFLFAGGIGNQSALLKLAADKPDATVVYRGDPRTSLYAINATPFVEGGVLYGPDQPGQFRAVKLESGERLWETNLPITGESGGKPVGSGTAFVVKNGDVFFLAGETGHLIIARLSPEGYDELSRWKMLEPTGSAFGREVVWSHPAFAQKCVFARNDKELICASLAAE
ncbi:MAG: pyrrolo-quinoline quinone [Planctomycetaceae bacterium]|nr:pyrrolo-quinoline quinone [Planctomycetaceae bacterium]